MDDDTRHFAIYMGLIAIYHHPKNDQPANARRLYDLTNYYFAHYQRRRGEHPCHGSSEEQSWEPAYSAAQPNIPQTNPTSTPQDATWPSKRK